MISTIQKDIVINGDISSTGDIVIHGQVKGTVNARSLKVEKEGSVVGNVTAQSVVSNGTIKGRIDAISVSLQIGSDTQSEITSNTLQVEISAKINGKCHIQTTSDNAKLPGDSDTDLKKAASSNPTSAQKNLFT
jgi:cytoskeletal protein CcmA (bactofilin family)